MIALDDAHLQLKLMEREPKTVEDALNLATKLEAYETSLSLPGKPDEVDDGRCRHKPKKIASGPGGSTGWGRFVLDTDALDQALGAILQQEQDGELKVIVYASI